MQDYRINVARVEELQMIGNKDELERFYDRAKTAIVNGASVELLRQVGGSTGEVFDRLTTLDELNTYFRRILKYL